MPCYYPLRAWRGSQVTEKGKRPLVFRFADAWPPLAHEPINVPCGRCKGCRLEYSRQWAVRMMHEAQTSSDSCFITLTYDDENLPEDRSLDKSEWQRFMKRLRKSVAKQIRFYHCGEYGEEHGRPHYHAIIFNHDFEDKKRWCTNQNGDPLFVSEELSSLWPFGFSSLGAVTFQSAAYVARYVMKKVAQPSSCTRIYICPESGKVWPIAHEYVTMSRARAIGSDWYRKYGDHTRSHDYVVMNGVKMKPPRLYDNLFEHEYPSDAKRVRLRRQDGARSRPRIESFGCRLRVKEEVKLAQISRLSKPL